MTLSEFEHATAEDGSLLELSRGVVAVIDAPGPKHLVQSNALRRQIHAFDAANPGVIHTIASGSECKIVVAGAESERHPDLAIYKSAPPPSGDLWSAWAPDVVIEVVSSGGERRDYVEKRDDYLLAGVSEYWIIDAQKREMLVLRLIDEHWEERLVHDGELYASEVLPGFSFNCSSVFAAADAVDR
jgi:Uma2 family endonuclease